MEDITFMILDNDINSLKNLSKNELNKKNSIDGSSYINDAVNVGNPKIVKLLLEKEVDIDVGDETPLIMINKIIKKNKCNEYLEIKNMLENEIKNRILKSKTQISSVKRLREELDDGLIYNINKKVSKSKNKSKSKKNKKRISKRKNAKYYK